MTLGTWRSSKSSSSSRRTSSSNFAGAGRCISAPRRRGRWPRGPSGSPRPPAAWIGGGFERTNVVRERECFGRRLHARVKRGLGGHAADEAAAKLVSPLVRRRLREPGESLLDRRALGVAQLVLGQERLGRT